VLFTKAHHLDEFDVAYDRYFPPDPQQRVRRLLKQILGDDSKYVGSPLIKQIVIDNNDYGNCRELEVPAFAENPKSAQNMKSGGVITFCPDAFHTRDLYSRLCVGLGDKMIGRMNSLASYLLHELT